MELLEWRYVTSLRNNLSCKYLLQSHFGELVFKNKVLLQFSKWRMISDYWFDRIFSPFNVFPFPLPSSKLLAWNSAAEHHSVHVTVSQNLSSTLGEHFWPVICAIKSDILEISVPWPANNTQLLFSPCHNSFNSSFKISLVYLLCITKNLIILYT